MILGNLNKQQIQALKDKDTLRVSVLRFLISAIKNKEIELRSEHRELTNDDIAKVIKKQIKQRNYEVDMYTTAGREEQAEKASSELKILEELQGLLPENE